MIANYHGHTTRCKHAEGEDRAYVENALKGGLKILGFSDHCPWIYDTDYVSGTRMFPYQLEDYVDSIARLRDEYSRDITIYIGLEAEYIPEMVEKQYELLDQYPLDYMILGQHFTGIEYESPYTGFETAEEAALVKYVDTVIEGMDTGRYAYVAHPDIFNYVGDSAIYEREYTRLCEYLKTINSPVEINMLGLVQGRHYPSDQFFKIAGKVGNTAIVGCDAHQPERLSELSSMKRCEDYAVNMGLELVHTIQGLDKLPDN